MTRTLHPALLISVALHLLLLWLIANKLEFNLSENIPIKRSPIHVSIIHQNMKPKPFKSHERTSLQNSEITETVEPQQEPQTNNQSVQKESSKQKIDQSSSPDGSRRRVTSAKIISSSSEVINKLSSDESIQTTIQKSDSVSAILDRALNPKRESPGITTQADGTTRVVTEKGFTYCIKPLDDWKIVDPEDDMRVSMYCR
ncbi:MAG: hypothetical protein ABW170_07340 [Candidatus Thiodiazotropha sp. L084R]